MTEITALSLSEIIHSLRNGEISSQDLTQAYLHRIDRFNPHLNAYITVTHQLAMQKSSQADKSLASWRANPSDTIPLLTGVPLAVKDLICVEGVPCTCGSLILENFIPPYSATVINKLNSAGALIIGKTNLDEFAMGSSTENSAYGITRNPWDINRVPGGSSGGSATAIAANLAPIALGTDTGGSIRQPASYCGITGLKPTYGRVSRYGLVAYGSSLDVIGVLGQDSNDVAIIFSHIAGHDPLDSTSVNVPVPGINSETLTLKDTGASGLKTHFTLDLPLKNLNVGVPEEYFVEGIQPEVENAVKNCIRRLEILGANIEHINLPHTKYAVPVYYTIAPAEASANLARYDGVRYGPRVSDNTLFDLYSETRGQKFGAEVKRRIMLGTYALSAGYYDAYYGQAQKVRTLIKGDYDRAFEIVDVIAAPVAPTTAFKIGEHRNDPLAMYLEDIFTLPANLAGIPGITFPVGFDQNGLPIGIQLMGPHFQEQLLLYIANIYQQDTDWHKHKPDILFQ